MRLLAVIFALIVTACAHPSQDQEPLQTLVPPSSPLDYSAQLLPAPEPLSAGEYLEMGFMALSLMNYEAAITHFKAAIDTGYLNRAGSVMCWWNISDCHERLDNEDLRAEALMMFMFHARELISEERKYAVEEGSSFREYFQVENRMTRARAILHALWIERTDYFAKSPNQALLVESQQELEMIIVELDPCPEGVDHTVIMNSMDDVQLINLTRVEIDCEEGEDFTLYAIVPTPEEEQ